MHYRLTKALACAVIAASITLSTAPAMGAEPLSGSLVHRLSGADRISTAIATAKAGFPSTTRAILATSQDWPDSMSATILAHHLEAPVLLTDKDKLDDSVLGAMQSMGVREVTVLGGTHAISDTIVMALEAQGMHVERLRGASRDGTAAAIAKAATNSAKTVVLTPGWGDQAWMAAIAGANFSYTNAHAPILLVANDTIPAETLAALESLGTTTAIIMGGTNDIEDSVLDTLASHGIETRRIESTSATGLAAKAVGENVGAYTGRQAVIASTRSFADALGASALAARHNAPLLLTDTQVLSEPTYEALEQWPHALHSVSIIGGTVAINPDVVHELERVIRTIEGEHSTVDSPTTGDIEVDSAIQDGPSNALGGSLDVGPMPGNGEPIDVNYDPNSQEYYEQLLAQGGSLGTEEGIASFYTLDSMTANGEAFNTWDMTAAHKTLPFGTIVRVTNLANNKHVVVRINDRGPYVEGRIIDLSRKAAIELDMHNAGVTQVRVDIIKYANS